MKTSLEHLPDAKRNELAQVLEVLFREFEEATKRKSSKRGQGRILKVILFGSYARGDWVDDPVGGYKSDYDLLVVVNHDDFADVTEYWMDAEERLEQAFDIAHTLTAPAHFIVHSLADVNRQLTRGRPFFTGILGEGVVLYEAPDHPLSRPEKLSPEEAYREAKANFDKWFPSASEFLIHGADALAGNLDGAAASNGQDRRGPDIPRAPVHRSAMARLRRPPLPGARACSGDLHACHQRFRGDGGPVCGAVVGQRPRQALRAPPEGSRRHHLRKGPGHL